MIKPFLIVGLPRCRTAWMSVAAGSMPRATCYHEPVRSLDRWQDIFSQTWRAHGPDTEFVGISDHSMGFHLAEIMERVAPRTLIIERPIEDVVESLRKIGIRDAGRYCELLLKRMEAAENAETRKLIRRVKFADLGHTATTAASLFFLMPDGILDFTKLGRLQPLNIQVHMPDLWNDAANLSSQQACAMLGHDVVKELRDAEPAIAVSK